MLLLPTFNARLNPCPVSPAAFTAHDQGHFCGQCQRVVQDFTQSLNPMADLAAARAASPDGRVCGTFRRSQVQAPALSRRLRWFVLALVLVVGQGLTANEALAQVRKASPGQHAAAKPRPKAKRPVVPVADTPIEAEPLISGTLPPPEQMMEHTPPPAPADGVYTYVEQMPEPPGGGGYVGIFNLFYERLHLSAAEAQDDTGGSVSIEFVVTETGAVTQARITRSGGRGIDAATLRAFRAMPRFQPGRQNGVPVKVRMTLRVACIKLQ